MLVSILI